MWVHLEMGTLANARCRIQSACFICRHATQATDTPQANMSLTTITTASNTQQAQDAFLAAVVSSDRTTLRQLIAAGAIANVNTVKDEKGRSVLFHVQDAAAAAFLIHKCGADVNARDSVGETPLFVAARLTHGIGIVRLLL